MGKTWTTSKNALLAAALASAVIAANISQTPSAESKPLDSAPSLDKISFNRDIRPILSDNCYYCHGPDEENNKAGLRLDLREEALVFDTIIPGDAENSEMILRVNTDDPSDLMPPPKSHKKLTGKQKELLTQWINEGAVYEDHWSYKPVQRPDYASINDVVTTELKKHNLTLSPAADKQTLLRRIYLDITGLPPTPEEAEVFLSDTSLNAYEKLIDRLLASPHYGENMAIHWLDAVRYADTVGYHGDQERDASPYRDYVIHAFNSNKPFDKFTIEQIAGDLLPNATIQQRVAASYNRLNQLSREGGIQDKEYLKKYQSERVRTTSTAWLGSTLACAECHDHKFDPFTAKDFYTFAAFFSDILEKGAWTNDGAYQTKDIKPLLKKDIIADHAGFGPAIRVPNTTFISNPASLEQELADRHQALHAPSPEVEAEFEQWLQMRTDLKPADIQAVFKLSIQEEEIASDVAISSFDRLGHQLRFQYQAEKTLRDNRRHFGVLLTFSDQKVFVGWGKAIAPPVEDARVLRRPLQHVSEKTKTLSLDLSKLPGVDPTKLRRIEWIIKKKPDSSDGWITISNVELDSNLYLTPNGPLSDQHAKELNTYLDQADPKVRENLKQAYYHRYTRQPDKLLLRRQYRMMENHLRGKRFTPATISAEPREVRILPRGNWMDDSGEIVTPATPHFLPDLRESSDERRLTRLDLAKWLVAPENPLTARTFVNRLWAQYFGIALSKAPEDLGLQGEYPVHAELLDWLAAEFVDSGWNIKHITKLIVQSDVYRQTSRATPELKELDPYNRLLARQSPRRLPAESIRDFALTASDLLVRRVGGASTRPYQPDGYYQHLNFPKREYEPDANENQYRRGVYTHWQRTFLHPTLMAFDAPGRDECTVSRSVSTTPLQALALLNDPSFVEAAKAMADKSLLVEASDEQRLQALFERALVRTPTSEESKTLLGLLRRERTRFNEAPEHAKRFLKVGMYQAQSSADSGELAAWTSVCRAVLNLNESITRY